MPCLPQPTRHTDDRDIPLDFKLPQRKQERQGTRDRSAEVRSQNEEVRPRQGFLAPLQRQLRRLLLPILASYSDFYFCIPTSYFCIRSDRVLATARLHIDQREIGAFAVVCGLNRNNVLILLGPNL